MIGNSWDSLTQGTVYEDDGNIVFANADKSLGPVSVTILKYIQDALVHLKDKDTYLIISEEEALLEDSNLRSEIKELL